MPVTLPRAHFDVGPDGHLTVTVDGRPWQPPSDDPTKPTQGAGAVRLGRSDVLWARQQIANELGTPILVEVVENGRPYSDVIDPDGYHTEEPAEALSGSEAGEGPYAPGEPIVISVVIDRTHADEHGHVRYRLPAALGNRTVLVQGETSQTTLPLDLVPRPERHEGAGGTSSRPPTTSTATTARRQPPGAVHNSRPASPAPVPRPAPRDTTDDRLGAL